MDIFLYLYVENVDILKIRFKNSFILIPFEENSFSIVRPFMIHKLWIFSHIYILKMWIISTYHLKMAFSYRNYLQKFTVLI